ncbi:MAG: DNA polymerase III subunit chi [Hydrogenophilus sp.]|nr:DNA polymerase III subunit chi [Hydrogenophilus sp.]
MASSTRWQHLLPMTALNIRFFIDEPDPLTRAVELVERAYRSGRGVALRAESLLLSELERRLWEGRARAFLPNLPAADPDAADTPIVLITPDEAPPNPRSVWVNLASPPFDPPNGCEWLFEIVGTAEAEKAQARARYRRYQQLGYSPLVKTSLPSDSLSR